MGGRAAFCLPADPQLRGEVWGTGADTRLLGRRASVARTRSGGLDHWLDHWPDRGLVGGAGARDGCLVGAVGEVALEDEDGGDLVDDGLFTGEGGAGVGARGEVLVGGDGGEAFVMQVDAEGEAERRASAKRSMRRVWAVRSPESASGWPTMSSVTACLRTRRPMDLTSAWSPLRAMVKRGWTWRAGSAWLPSGGARPRLTVRARPMRFEPTSRARRRSGTAGDDSIGASLCAGGVERGCVARGGGAPLAGYMQVSPLRTRLPRPSIERTGFSGGVRELARQAGGWGLGTGELARGLARGDGGVWGCARF